MLRTDRWTRLVTCACAGLVLTAGLAAAQKMGQGVPQTQEAMEKSHAKIEAELDAASKDLVDLRTVRERLKKAEAGTAVPVAGGTCEKGTVEDALLAAETLGVSSSLMMAKGIPKDLATYSACRAVTAQSEAPCEELKQYRWQGAAQDCRDYAVMSLVAKAMVTRNAAVANGVCRFKDLPSGLAGPRCEAWAKGAASGASVPEICAKLDAMGGGDCESLRWIAGLASLSECSNMEQPDEKKLCRQFSSYRIAAKSGGTCQGALCEALLSGSAVACARQGLDLKARICGFSQAQKGVNDKMAALNGSFVVINDRIEGYQPKSDPWVSEIRRKYQALHTQYEELTPGAKGGKSQGKQPR